jgi:YidC/Oxa1 family membrane protein insertase
MEPRRIALAVVLMAAVLVVTPFLFPAKPVPPKAAGTTADSVRMDSAVAAPSASNVQTAAPLPAPTASMGAAVGADSTAAPAVRPIVARRWWVRNSHSTRRSKIAAR